MGQQTQLSQGKSQKVTQPILSLREMSSSFKPKLIIPEEVQKIIRAWCFKSHDTEWSGTLWYTVEGSFEEENLTITCKDIYVSDIGTAGYTEFDVKPEIVSYMCEKPDLLDCFMGLIH